jgi:DDE family transposase
MPHDRALYQWHDRLATRLADLPEPHRGALATASYGIALAGRAAVSAVALHLAAALGLAAAAARHRLRALYRPAPAGRDDFDPAVCFGPLLRWAAAGAADRRLALAIDPTDLGGRFLILTVSVLYRRCAIPVAWHVRPAHQSGSWNDRWKALLGGLHDRLGEGWEVVVLSDRGLESPDLFAAVVGLGWHPLMRVKAAGTFRPQGWHKGYPMRRFAAAVGRRWKGAGVAYPGGAKLACTLLACWEEGHEAAWLVLTDLPAAAADVRWYGFRAWIEQGFKRLKSGGWQLEANRMTDPDRVARWLAAVALATLWALEAGGGDEALRWAGGLAGLAAAGVSLFALGALWLRRALGGGRAAPRGRWHPTAWVIDPRPSDPLQEHELCQTAEALPL